MKGLYVFEISETQRCFHIDTLEQSLTTNLWQTERFFKGEKLENVVHDYRPLFIGTAEEVYDFSRKYHDHIAAINPRHKWFGTLEQMAMEE